MELILLLLWLTVWLLFWIFITIGSTPVNTSRRRTHVLNGLLSLGVVLALLCTTVLVVRIVLLDMMPELGPILLDYLMQAIKNRSSGHTVI